MSSLRKSARVRPKSPPLQPVSAAPIENKISTDEKHRIASHCGMPIFPANLTAAATATIRCALGRTIAAAGLVGLAFDPNDGKDQNGPRAFERSDMHPRVRLPRRRKFNDRPHPQLSLIAAEANSPATRRH
jgi:hypothetical protein